MSIKILTEASILPGKAPEYYIKEEKFMKIPHFIDFYYGLYLITISQMYSISDYLFAQMFSASKSTNMYLHVQNLWKRSVFVLLNREVITCTHLCAINNNCLSEKNSSSMLNTTVKRVIKCQSREGRIQSFLHKCLFDHRTIHPWKSLLVSDKQDDQF